MQPTPKIRSLLVIGSLLATAIGGTILVAPTAFHAANGIELAADANLLSEVRAPGGALFGFGVFMLAGAFVRSLTRPAVAVGALVYLAYGGARLLSICLDGVPGASLLLAAGIELVVGLAFAGALRRAGYAAAARQRAR